jgi:hypothetical protein
VNITTRATLYDPSGVGAAVVITELNVACAADSMLAHNGHVFMSAGGAFYQFERRLKLLDNTVALPAEVAGSSGDDDTVSTCPSATKSYLNRGKCVRTSGCAPPIFSSAETILNEDNLIMMHNLSRRCVYYVTGLRLENHAEFSPCKPQNGRSRWRKLGGACTAPTALDETTRHSLVATLAASTDVNVHIRDINIPEGSCVTEQDDGVSVVGSNIEVDGTCWEHVHPDTLSVRDFNYWASVHPGGEAAIERFANEGGAEFRFPASHAMSRWEQHKPKLAYLGRFGDSVSFSALPTEVQTVKIAKRLGALEERLSDSVLACGSPGEVRNKPELGHQFEFIEKTWSNYDGGLEFDHIHRKAKGMVVLNVVLKAKDQFRQRMAW